MTNEIDREKLETHLKDKIIDCKMLYDAMGDDKIIYGIKAFEHVLAWIKANYD